MSEPAEKFANNLAMFIVQAENTAPHIDKITEVCHSALRRKKAELRERETVVRAIRETIGLQRAEIKNVESFAMALQQTIARSKLFPSSLQAKLAECRQKISNPPCKQADSASRIILGRADFSEKYTVSMIKNNDLLGLTLENDRFGVRVADVTDRLLNSTFSFCPFRVLKM